MLRKIVSVFQWDVSKVQSVLHLFDVVKWGSLQNNSDSFDSVKRESSSTLAFNHVVKHFKFDGKTLLDLALERADENVVLYVKSQLLPGALKTLYDFVSNALNQKKMFDEIVVSSGVSSMALIHQYSVQYGVTPLESHKEQLYNRHDRLLKLRDAFLAQDYSEIALILRQDPSVLEQKVNDKTFLTSFMGVWNWLPEMAVVVMGLVKPAEAEIVFKGLIREQAFGLQNTGRDVIRRVVSDPAFSAQFSVSFNSVSDAQKCMKALVPTISDQDLGGIFKPIFLGELDTDALAQFKLLLKDDLGAVSIADLLKKCDRKLYPKAYLVLDSLRFINPKPSLSVSSNGDVLLPLTRSQLNGVLSALKIKMPDAVLAQYFPEYRFHEGVAADVLAGHVSGVRRTLSEDKYASVPSADALRDIFVVAAQNTPLGSILRISGNKMALGISGNQADLEACFRKLFDRIGYGVTEPEIQTCLQACGTDTFVPIEKILSVMRDVQEQKMLADHEVVLSSLLSRKELVLKEGDEALTPFASDRAIEHFSATALLSSLSGTPANFKVLFELLMCSKMAPDKVDKLLRDILSKVSGDSGHLLVFIDSLFKVLENTKSPFQDQIKLFVIKNASDLLGKMSSVSRESYKDFRLFHLLIRFGNGSLATFVKDFPDYIKRVANLPDSNGNTAFHVAAESGNDTAVDCFSNLGIAHDKRVWRNAVGKTPLHLSVAKIKMVTSEKLMRLYQMHQQMEILKVADADRRTLLHVALATNSGVVVTEFKSKLNSCTGDDALFAALALCPDVYGDLPLHLAVKQSMEQTFDWLSGYYSGEVPRGLLHAAVLTTNSHFFALIISKFPGLNVNEFSGKGDSALFIACKNNQFYFAQALIEIGCKPESDFLYKLVSDKTLLTLQSACRLFKPKELAVCFAYHGPNGVTVMDRCDELNYPAGRAYLEDFLRGGKPSAK